MMSLVSGKAAGRRAAFILALIGLLGLPLAISRRADAQPPRPAASAAAPQAQPGAISYWGMNVYLTKNERIVNGDNLDALAASARDAGAQWTLEEFRLSCD